LITHIQGEHGIGIRIATCGVTGNKGQKKIKHNQKIEESNQARPEVYDQTYGMMRHPGEDQLLTTPLLYRLFLDL
jgi:hypothetical protein